MLTVVN